MQHNTEYKIQDTENSTENNAQVQHRTPAQHQRTSNTDNLYIYSVDFYHEYVAIKNSNTIELYTILKD